MLPTFEESGANATHQGAETNVEASTALAAALGIIKTMAEAPKTTVPPSPLPLQSQAVEPDLRYEKLLESTAGQYRADEVARRCPLLLDPRHFLSPTNVHHLSPPQHTPLPTTTASTVPGLSSLCACIQGARAG